MAKVQIKRTATPNAPPTGLLPGELSVEMADPAKLWVGVPPAIDASERKLLIDTSIGYVKRAGDTMTGPLILPADPVAAMEASTRKFIDDQMTPYFHAVTAAPFPVTPETYLAIPLVAGYDTHAAFSGYAWRPPVPGYYYVAGCISVPSVGNHTAIALWESDGTTYHNTRNAYDIAVGGNGTYTATLVIQGVLKFDGVNDRVELIACCDYPSGGAVNVAEFYGWKLVDL